MNFSKAITKIALSLLLASAGITQSAQAQEFPSDPNWTITAYLWAMSLDGTVGIGPIEADLDTDPFISRQKHPQSLT